MFFILGLLFDWRSIATWDWTHINRLSGVVDITMRLTIAIVVAILFGLSSDAIFFGWFLPRLLTRNSRGGGAS
jgi:hypothetical protein